MQNYKDLLYLPAETFSEFFDKINQIKAMLNSLINKVRATAEHVKITT